MPAPAVKFLADNAALSDEAFREGAIIDLLRARIANVQQTMLEQLTENLYWHGSGFVVASDTFMDEMRRQWALLERSPR